MSLYQVGETWYVYITHGGQRVRRSTGLTNKKGAQRFHDELKASLWKETARPSGRTWQEACVAWITAAPRSESDRYALRALCYDDRPLIDCTVDSFEESIGGKSPATFNRIGTIVNAILHLAEQKGWIEKAVRIPKRQQRATGYRFLTLEEWRRLYVELPDHLKAPARFSLATGLRQHNTFYLRWNKVDLRRKMVWVEPEDAKGRKAIGLPLSDEAVEVLRGQIGKNEEWVFPYSGKGRTAGRPIGDIKTAWQNALERAGLGHAIITFGTDGKRHREWAGDFRWHDFRHTFASWHVMSGTPLEVLQKLGGWSDMRMLMKYAHLAPEYIAGYANNAKPWSQKEAMGVA